MAIQIGAFEIEWVDGEDPRGRIAREQAAVAALSKAYRLASHGELPGEEIAWPRADGYARYLVAREKPLELLHLAIGDAWQVESALIRGLRRKDVRNMVMGARALSSLFQNRGHRPEQPEDKDTVIEAGIEAAQTVVDTWQQGDLAGALNQLEDWATQAADYLSDSERSLSDKERRLSQKQ